jgi:hypothetical protein
MALVADTQYGFPGEITPSAWATIIGNASGGVFGVGAGAYSGIGELKLSPNSVGDRGAILTPGLAYGHGCVGIWNTSNQFNFAAPSGTSDRWDCIVIRRTWSSTPGASVTTLAVKTGTSTKAIPALTMNPGVQTEQPLWLVRLKGGQTSVQELVDLRCFAANGGVQAMDTLALGYLESPGSRVEVGGNMYEFRANAGTTAIGWEVVSSIASIPIFGPGGALAGNAANAPFGQFLVQAGTVVQSTDGSGYARLTWPKPFPNGLLTVILTNGDSWSTAAVHLMVEGNSGFWGSSGLGNKENVVYMARRWIGVNEMAKNLQHRVNYIAIGF